MAGMRMGLLLGFEDSLDTLVTLAREGEAAGLHSLYTVEAGRSAFVPAAAVVSATQRVRVGTYIVNAYAREPWLTGLAAREHIHTSDASDYYTIADGLPQFSDYHDALWEEEGA